MTGREKVRNSRPPLSRREVSSGATKVSEVSVSGSIMNTLLLVSDLELEVHCDPDLKQKCDCATRWHF